MKEGDTDVIQHYVPEEEGQEVLLHKMETLQRGFGSSSRKTEQHKDFCETGTILIGSSFILKLLVYHYILLVFE